MSSAKVLYERDGVIGRLTLNSPESMNALSEELLEELFQRLREANSEKATKVLVIDCAGDNFCAGADLGWEHGLDGAASLGLLRLSGHLSYELRNGPKPTIGAIRGYCLGGGLELNLHFDLSIASETAKFALPETKWGVLPFWNSPQLLPLMIGERRAREVMMMGRVYDAEQAYELGLCNLVVPEGELEDEVSRWAEELAQRSSASLRLVKVALNGAADALQNATNHEALLVTTTAGSDRWRDEVHQFFDLPRDSRRPIPAWPTRVRRS